MSATACLKSFCRDPLVNSEYVYDRTATMWMTFLFGTVEHDVAPDVDDENLPASQSVQEVADDNTEYLPAVQSLQMVEPMPEPYLPASQSVQEVALVTALPPPDEIHIALKPLVDVEPSDVNVTLRIPVDDLYTFDELRDDPECLRSSVRSDDPHAAVLH